MFLSDDNIVYVLQFSFAVQKILYTVSKSDFSVFYDMSDLGVDKQNTDAEVRDALEVCKRAKEEFMANIASIPVDNAAKAVATRVADSLIESCLTSRDPNPAHCADLLSKDLATCPIVKDILVEANEVYKFVSIDCIDSMRIQAKQQCHLPEATAAVNNVDTCMNLIHNFVWVTQNQGTFIAYLPMCDPFKKYYDEHTTQSRRRRRRLMAFSNAAII
jgi:hypothetical protein